ncbi:hypothetical protein HYC85_007004 [Camellia sinensis]|uniref:NOT2/NOT3/NOT5 C-terminal domain-containing protein n=1 Tax=Camellia sinensis TaxID=4442 RepID=A0A7J7HQ77_CAMSI|nr:hypothetical protein HYC85_007004 [Camellia sinensis]
MGRSAGFNLGGSYSLHRPQQQQQHAPSTSGPPGIGLRPLNSPNTVSGMGSYDQLIQQYQQHQSHSQFRLQQMSGVNQSYRDQGVKSMQAPQAAPDPFGLLGLLSVIRMSDPDLTSLALGIDLTTLGLNLNSTENLHKTFGSPWSDEPAKGDPEFSLLSFLTQIFVGVVAAIIQQRLVLSQRASSLVYEGFQCGTTC